MKLKNIIPLSVCCLIFSLLFINCSEWTEPEANNYFKFPEDAYYESLRAFKKTDHQVSFGWFGNWTGVGSSLVNSMRGIPDSLDIVSIWGNWSNLTPEKKADLKYCQEVKGTKFVICIIITNVGSGINVPEEHKENPNAYWGWDDANPEPAIHKYANAICDTIDKYGYDGFDIDFEPHYGNPGNLASYNDRMLIFIKALRERLGNYKDTGKLLVIDGEPQSIHPESGPLFDYLIVQAYNSPGDYNLNTRLQTTVANFNGHLTAEEVTNKYIVTENFESVAHAMSGGYNFIDQYGNSMKSLEGMARWQPNNGFRKGGCGTYHMEAEYPTTPEYKWMRNAIQIMNPAIK